jgi:hypothetical protein
MISFELLRDDGILVVEPQGTLEVSDFEALTRAVDPFIEENDRLQGLLIQSESFPGWGDFGALLSHLNFIRDHHRDIDRVAAVTDSAFLSIAPRVASHFIQAEVRHFNFGDRESAIEWLRGNRN